MEFRAMLDLTGLPQSLVRDPPFRQIDFEENRGVRAMAALLRNAWMATSSGDGGADAVWQFMRNYCNMSQEEQAEALLANKDTADIHSTWRNTVYELWSNVFAETAGFVWGANARAGHWHDSEKFAALNDGDNTIGTLVVNYGQCGDNALYHVFEHNVLVCPAYFDGSANIKLERLPTNNAVKKADVSTKGAGGTETDVYFLETQKDLDVYENNSGTIIWWIRRDVPVRFHAELLEGEEKHEGTAAILVYGNLCMVCDLDAEFAALEAAEAAQDGQAEES